MNQIKLLKNETKAYGGELFRTRKGRSQPRPLATNQTMHLVLRSQYAKGTRSFLAPNNRTAIRTIIKKFAEKYGIKILSGANVGNHLHIHLKLSNRQTYRPFIRAITSAIAAAVMGLSRWKTKQQLNIKHFWDYRPFTRVVVNFQGYLNLQDYIAINKLEARGVKRETARMFLSRLQPRGP